MSVMKGKGRWLMRPRPGDGDCPERGQLRRGLAAVRHGILLAHVWRKPFACFLVIRVSFSFVPVTKIEGHHRAGRLIYLEPGAQRRCGRGQGEAKDEHGVGGAIG
jgi:hypothetical protein